MDYNSVRILALLIISLCFYFVRKKKGTFKYILSRKTKIIRVIVIILIVVIVFLPFEAPFIRFDSAEDSLRYSAIQNNDSIKTIETEKTVFCVSHKDNNWGYHTITKFDDKYGFCDRHSTSTQCFRSPIFDDQYDHGIIYATKIINNDTNEKCYMIVPLSIEPLETEDICIYDKHNTPIEKFTFSDNRSVFVLVVNQADEESSFTFNGKTYDLDEMIGYLGV